jgi:anti-sigma B factor antagonist
MSTCVALEARSSPAAGAVACEARVEEKISMSAPALRHLKVKNVDGVAVVDFVDSGLMFESALIEEIGEELRSLLIDHHHTRILLDFTHVQYLSSSMLGQLARLAKDVKAAGGQLKITGLGPVLLDTFRISHFEPLFSIYESEVSALKAFHA